VKGFCFCPSFLDYRRLVERVEVLVYRERHFCPAFFLHLLRLLLCRVKSFYVFEHLDLYYPDLGSNQSSAKTEFGSNICSKACGPPR
jgi:hypothetical protein